MSDADAQPMSHADRHDLDKLARWRSGLDAAVDTGGSSFPACAMFLVTGEDRASHDIFRRYRSAFEDLGGGFHHLVIFGQHGISTTQQAFLKEVGMDQSSVPLLVLAPTSEDSNDAYCIELQKGDPDGDLDESQPWGAALRLVEAAAGGAELSFEGIGSSPPATLPEGGLAATVGKVMADLAGDR